MRGSAEIIQLVSDPEVMESLRVALEEEALDREVPFEDLRRKYGTQSTLRIK